MKNRPTKRPLTEFEKQRYAPYFQAQTLRRARIVDGRVPRWLARNMIAVVLGDTIYFRPQVYQPHTPHGVELLAHELTHVEQFLNGMTLPRYLWASRRGYHKNPYEIAAYAKGAQVRCDLCET